MSTSRILVDKSSTELEEYIRKVLDANQPEHSFLPQLRVHAAKARHHTRRTFKLDPVAEYFIYDFCYRNRAKFRKPLVKNRQHYGYRFEGGMPIDGVDAYGAYKASISTWSKSFSHALSFDIASYFTAFIIMTWCIGVLGSELIGQMRRH